MNIKQLTFSIIIFCFSVIAYGQQQVYVLETELKTTYTGTGDSKLFTYYTYDASGNRIKKRVYNGADSLSNMLSHCEYVYDVDGKILKEILIASVDTLSIVESFYNGDEDLICVKTLDSDGNLRFIDSLFYLSPGILAQEARYVNGNKTFYHKYSYSNSNKVADSLFEKNISDFIATQAVLFSYSAQGNVTKEEHFVYLGGKWSQDLTVTMEYSTGALTSVSRHKGAGTSGALVDSLAFEYDVNNNCSRESKYNDEKVLAYTIDYTWKYIGTVLTHNSNNKIHQNISMRIMHGTINVKSSYSLNNICIYDIAGRTIVRHPLNNRIETRIKIPSQLACGRYVAVLSSNSGNILKKAFTIN